MADCLVWVDSEKAQIFDLEVNGIVRTTVKRHEVNHHTHNRKDHHGDPATTHFYRDLASRLGNAEGVLLMGPGLAKDHFKSYLEDDAKSGLARKIVGIETCDHPTDNQILALGRKFFKTYNLYHRPIREEE